MKARRFIDRGVLDSCWCSLFSAQDMYFNVPLFRSSDNSEPLTLILARIAEFSQRRSSSLVLLALH